MRLVNELLYMILNKSLSLNVIKEEFNIERATAQRDMALLRKLGFVEFKGAPKTVHYVLTDKVKKLKLKRR